MKPSSKKLDLRTLFMNYSVYIVLIVLLAYFSIANGDFLSTYNIENFLQQVPPVGILTVAYTMILICGYVDLSIGYVGMAAGMLGLYVANHGVPAPFVLVIVLATGAILGTMNALLIKKFDLPSFILTLGSSYVIKGMLGFFTNEQFIGSDKEWYNALATTPIIGDILKSNALIFVAVIVIFAFVMKNTRFGKYTYAVGSNPEAARLSGIDTDKHVIKVFIIEGMLAAVAGLLIISNLQGGASKDANGLDLFAMAAAIMGGTSFSGGIGTIGGAVAGILTLQVFKNGLTLMGVNSFLQDTVTGLVIILAIIVDYIKRKTSSNT
ncbi:MAG: ABC transporter permease [Lactococcus chungangensis]|jgi:ribose/xylose/arabinose/galactoside ABC-type transport system permease subunit|uniref:Autoinducer 2 import system permease protein LsrD n=1 Tax=Pseudolactococcus chungangensis TaxID=451457 RepID=A0A847J5T0_9LACT|nr:ABC transporter permease [Lactococcus chungangensis]